MACWARAQCCARIRRLIASRSAVRCVVVVHASSARFRAPSARLTAGMSKRACPFEDHCEPQRKRYVAARDIAVRDGAYRKSVYDKTLNLLFSGVNNNCVLAVAAPPENTVPARRLCVECNDVRLIRGNCWFCEVSLCAECIKSCSLCSEQFCSRCCVAIFKNGNNYCCLTCYS